MILLLALPLTTLALVRPRQMILAVLFVSGIPISIFVRASVPLGPLGLVAPQAAYLLAVSASLLIALLLSPGHPARVMQTFSVFVAFLIYSTITLIWSPDFVEGVRLLVKLLTLLLTTAVVIQHLRNAASLRLAENSIMAGAGLVLLLALLNQASGGAIGEGRTQWVARGILAAPFMSPANFSFLMCVAALVALARRLTTGGSASLALFVAFGLATILAYTRISMAGLIISVCLLFAGLGQSSTTRFAVPLTLIVVSIAAIFSLDVIRDRMFYSTADADFSLLLNDSRRYLEMINTSGRRQLWSEVLDYYRSANPMVGAGIGATDHWLGTQSDANALHSEYLRIYVDTGFLGLGLFVGSLLQIMWVTVRSRRSVKSRLAKRLSAQYRTLCLALFAFFVITMATDNSLNYVSELGVYVFAAIGFMLVSSRSIEIHRSALPPFPKPGSAQRPGGRQKTYKGSAPSELVLLLGLSSITALRNAQSRSVQPQVERTSG